MNYVEDYWKGGVHENGLGLVTQSLICYETLDFLACASNFLSVITASSHHCKDKMRLNNT